MGRVQDACPPCVVVTEEPAARRCVRTVIQRPTRDRRIRRDRPDGSRDGAKPARGGLPARRLEPDAGALRPARSRGRHGRRRSCGACRRGRRGDDGVGRARRALRARRQRAPGGAPPGFDRAGDEHDRPHRGDGARRGGSPSRRSPTGRSVSRAACRLPRQRSSSSWSGATPRRTSWPPRCSTR